MQSNVECWWLSGTIESKPINCNRTDNRCYNSQTSNRILYIFFSPTIFIFAKHIGQTPFTEREQNFDKYKTVIFSFGRKLFSFAQLVLFNLIKNKKSREISNRKNSSNVRLLALLTDWVEKKWNKKKRKEEERKTNDEKCSVF